MKLDAKKTMVYFLLTSFCAIAGFSIVQDIDFEKIKAENRTPISEPYTLTLDKNDNIDFEHLEPDANDVKYFNVNTDTGNHPIKFFETCLGNGTKGFANTGDYCTFGNVDPIYGLQSIEINFSCLDLGEEIDAEVYIGWSWEYYGNDSGSYIWNAKTSFYYFDWYSLGGTITFDFGDVMPSYFYVDFEDGNYNNNSIDSIKLEYSCSETEELWLGDPNVRYRLYEGYKDSLEDYINSSRVVNQWKNEYVSKLKELGVPDSEIMSLEEWEFQNKFYEDDRQFYLDAKYATILESNVEELTVPAEIYGFPVEILEDDFDVNGKLKSISFEENSNFKGVQTHLFAQNEKIQSVELPESTEFVAREAFRECLNLTNVVLNDGLLYLGEGAFSRTPVSSVNIPKTVKYYGGRSKSVFEYLDYITVDPENPYFTDLGGNALVWKDCNDYNAELKNGEKYADYTVLEISSHTDYSKLQVEGKTFMLSVSALKPKLDNGHVYLNLMDFKGRLGGKASWTGGWGEYLGGGFYDRVAIGPDCALTETFYLSFYNYNVIPQVFYIDKDAILIGEPMNLQKTAVIITNTPSSESETFATHFTNGTEHEPAVIFYDIDPNNLDAAFTYAEEHWMK